MAFDDENKPGIGTRLAVGAPIVTGIGVGVRRLLKSSTFNQSIGGIKSSQNQFMRTISAKINTTGSLPFSGNLGIMAGQNPEMIKLAWDMALQSADPGKIIPRDPLDTIDPAASIMAFNNRNKSIQGNKVLQSFVKQLSALETHAVAAGGSFSAATFGKAKRFSFLRSNKAVATIEDDRLRMVLTSIQDKIQGIPGAESNLQLARREGLDGSQLMLHMFGGRFGSGVALEIPMEIQPGIIAHGVTQQTKRVVGRYALTDGNRVTSTLNHEQFVARRFYEQILPKLLNDKLSVSKTKRLVRNFNREMIEGSQWVPNLPRNMFRAHDIATQLGGQRISLFDANFNALNMEQASPVLANAANGLFASTSPTQLSKGVVSTLDAQKFWLGGHAFGWERRPMQALGRGYGPSAKSLAARATSKTRLDYSWMMTEDYKKMFQGSEMGVMARTLYVNEDKHVKFADAALGGNLGGAGLMSTQLNDQLEHVEGLNLNLSKVNEKLLGGSAGSEFSVDATFREGEILGYDINNHPVVYKNGMNITGGFHYTSEDVPFVRLQGTRILEDERNPKFFGSGKFVANRVNQSTLEKTIRDTTGIRVPGVQVALGMDELKKNRGLHNMQMLSGLHEFTVHQMKRKGQTLDVTSFSKSVQDMMSRSAGRSVYDHTEVVEGVLNMARQHELDPFAMGRIFGAVPKVLGDQWRNDAGEFGAIGKLFNAEEVAHIEQGMASGVGSFFYGGPGYTGGAGSVETRVFELLKGKQYGALGPAMANDLARRQILSNPDIVQEQGILAHAASSLARGTKSMDGVAEYHLKDLKDKHISDILSKGGIVHTGGVFDDLTSIYVPGSDMSRSMRGHITMDGVESRSELAHTYRDLLEVGQRIGLGKDTRAAGTAAVNDLAKEVVAAHAGTITGEGVGLARRSVTGSRYLKITPGSIEELGDVYTQGVSRQHAVNMFQELEELHANNPAELAGLKAQKERMLAGEAIGAIGIRNPTFGPYSVNHTKLKIVKSLKDSDSIMIPTMTDILQDSSGNEIARVARGALPGQSGDYDGDNAHIMLTSSTLEKDIMGHYSAGANKEMHLFEEYTLRQQLLKAKAVKEAGYSSTEEMIAGARKLGLTKSHVGELSVALREMSAGMVEHGNLPVERQLNAMSLLEALEQSVISSKHVPTSQIDNLERQVKELANAARAGRGDHVASIAKDVFKNNDIASSLFAGETQEFMVNGNLKKIKGMDLAQVAEDLAYAVSNYTSESSGLRGNVARGLLNGRRDASLKDIMPYLEHSGGLFSEFKLGVSKGQMSKVAEAAMSIKNKAMSMGAEAIGHMGKPLAIGFGAALAISAALSKPLNSLDPESTHTPINAGRVQTANASSLPPENIHPDPNVTGEPTTSSPLTGPSVRHSPDNNAARIHIRGINRSGANVGSISSLISQRLRGNTNVNVNIRDRKTSLSQQKIDSLNRR